MFKKIFSLLIATCIVIALAGCTTDDKKENVSLYFANKDILELAKEEREVAKDEKFVENVVNELLKGPKQTANSRVIPENTKLISVTGKTEGLTINLSREFGDTKNQVEELLARYSVVSTLCNIESIQKIMIEVEGSPLKSKETGQEIGWLDKESVIMEPPSATNSIAKINLYFSNEDATFLKCEERQVEVKESSTVEKVILNELIKGPKESGNIKTIPTDTKLLSVETKDDICYVSLSSEFVDNHPGGTSAELMTIYSVVNSLTELWQIQSVQFLIEGEKMEVYKHMQFNEPFKRDELLIMN